MGRTKVQKHVENGARGLRTVVSSGVGGLGTKAKELGGTIDANTKELRKELGDRTKDTRKRVGYWIAGEESPKRHVGRSLIALGAGAVAAFFFDPSSGKRRRVAALEWVGSKVGRGRTEPDTTTPITTPTTTPTTG